MIGLSGSDLEMETWTLLSGRTLRSCHLWNNIIAEPGTETGSWVSASGGELLHFVTLKYFVTLCVIWEGGVVALCPAAGFFLAVTDTAGDSSDILTTKQEAQFQSGLKSW